MNDAFFKALDRAIAVAAAHEREILAVPGVLAVGAGPERRRGKITGEAAIIVTVRSKRDLAAVDAAGGARLPERIDDVPVDVIEQGAPMEAPEIVAAQERARAVLETVREQTLKTPNVTAIGIGYKSVGGETDFTTIALKIFVERKLPLDEVRRRNLPEIPPVIGGVVTDVEEMSRQRPVSSASGSRDDRRDPIVGGLTVGVNTKPFWYGTLGSIVFDRGTGEQMVLSNQHVLDGAAGTDVVQPSPIGLDDSLEIGFQLDVCAPIHFFRLDTPNTVVGSVLAGAAAGAALAAALSDEIDPTRRGQEATVPPAGAKTLFETQRVKLSYPELPIPGTHFKIGAAWEYQRHTDMGTQAHVVDEVKVNPHALADKLLFTDRRTYYPGDTIRLFGLILPEPCAPKPSEPPRDPLTLTDAELAAIVQRPNLTPLTLSAGTTMARAAVNAVAQPRCRCDRYYCTAILTPTTVDRAFPIVLQQPSWKDQNDLLKELITLVQRLDDRELLARVFRLVRYGCLYVGALDVVDIPKGPWKHYFYVQTVNYAAETMKPTEMAQIIGGLPVSQNTTPQLDVACGPFVFEDGSFDVELL